MKNFIKEVFSRQNLREVILLVGLRNPNLSYEGYSKVKDFEENDNHQVIQHLRGVA